MFSTSNDLYYKLSFESQQEFNAILTMITNNSTIINCVPTRVRIKFIDGLLSLSPGILINIPKPVLLLLIGTISSEDILTALRQSSSMNFITTVSLSKSLFNCLPHNTLLSLLKFIASKSPIEISGLLPPSTLFGFYENLFDTLNDRSLSLEKPLPISLTEKIIAPIMTSRMLSVYPIHGYENLLAFIGSSVELCKQLPATYFVSLFITINKSPNIFVKLDPYYLSNIMLSVQYKVPTNVYNELLNSIAIYLPLAQTYVHQKPT